MSSLRTHAASHNGQHGFLVVNADDWGRDRETTDRILNCVKMRSVSAVSAMMFMEDSERAAAIGLEHGVSSGLHLNLTEPFSIPGCSGRLFRHQQRTAGYLLRHRLSQVVFNPSLAHSFKYVVSAQIDEFHRRYGVVPSRIDGHHHMHLSANVVLARLLPAGTLLRRNFSFQPGEKSRVNRWYRHLLDRRLSRRHRMLDRFYSLAPLTPRARIDRIFALSQDFSIELETHPVNRDEYEFLAGREILDLIESHRIIPPPTAPNQSQSTHSDAVTYGRSR